MSRIKLIWDFRGPNALHIAKHHATHLEEFVSLEQLENTTCGTEQVTANHGIAFIITEKDNMNFLRERLQPNRGQLYKP